MPFFSSIAAECSFSLEYSIIFSAIMSNQAKPVQQKQNAACFWLSVFLVLLKSSAKPNRTTTISSPTYRQNQLINCTYICVLGTEQTRQKIATCSSVHNAGKKGTRPFFACCSFLCFLLLFQTSKWAALEVWARKPDEARKAYPDSAKSSGRDTFAGTSSCHQKLLLLDCRGQWQRSGMGVCSSRLHVTFFRACLDCV